MMDVWITLKKDWPYPERTVDVTTNYITTLEWAFLDPSWLELSDTNQAENATNVPYHLYMKIDMQTDHAAGTDTIWTYDYNIIDFVPLEPHWTVFDISLCYSQINKAHFVIDFPGTHKEWAWGSLPVVKDWLMMSLAIWGQVESQLRISNIEFDFTAENKTANQAAIVTALFTILDIVPVKGNPEHIIEQKSLPWISEQLNKSVSAGKFEFLIPDPNNPQQTGAVLTAIPTSFRKVERWDVSLGERFGPKGPAIYTAGALAGISIGVAILGLII